MRIMTVLGTRPEIIRLSCIIPKLDTLVDHVLVHTGQNYAPGLSDVFFQNLGLRQPDKLGNLSGGSAVQRVGEIMAQLEESMLRYKPDRLLVLGDTDSGLAAYVASRHAIPVFHMEAGNRCFDWRVPEETNRRAIDHCSNILLPYTENSRANLLREGFSPNRVFVTGNPIWEVMCTYDSQIVASGIKERLGVTAGQYMLATFHRAENVDVPERLVKIFKALSALATLHDMPVLVSCHPRTKLQIDRQGIKADQRIRLMEPLGFFDFMALQKQAKLVLSDSGTVQEEAALLNVPCVTMRDVTERPETIDYGSNLISGVDEEAILRCATTALSCKPQWNAPPDYRRMNVSDTVVRILMNNYEGLPDPAFRAMRIG